MNAQPKADGDAQDDSYVKANTSDESFVGATDFYETSLVHSAFQTEIDSPQSKCYTTEEKEQNTG